MVLLIDTNIVLDVLQNREQFVKEASLIWKLCETGQIKGYISSLSYVNMMYIMRKQLTPEQIEAVFRKLHLIFEFADLESSVLEKASIKVTLLPPEGKSIKKASLSDTEQSKTSLKKAVFSVPLFDFLTLQNTKTFSISW